MQVLRSSKHPPPVPEDTTVATSGSLDSFHHDDMDDEQQEHEMGTRSYTALLGETKKFIEQELRLMPDHTFGQERHDDDDGSMDPGDVQIVERRLVHKEDSSLV